jgi:probable rRNA maturation factor
LVQAPGSAQALAPVSVQEWAPASAQAKASETVQGLELETALVQELAQIRLKKLLEVAQSLPGLARLSRRKPWVVHLKVVGRARIQKLNQMYRNRAYPTDVLSFSAPEPFRALGILGELVIGLPVLKAQARRLGHSPSAELDVLLVHGLLHLLGLDHEEGPKEAQVMAQWEVQLLSRWGRPESRDLGLIDRSHSGSKKG